MTTLTIVPDTNVIVAALEDSHQHHAASAALMNAGRSFRLAVPAHCYAEAFTTLTRRGVAGPFQWPANEALAALESVAAATTLVGLSPSQSFSAVRDFAGAGHIGARIDDYLIARAAQACGAQTLVTWNTGHFQGLIAGLDVRTPTDMLDR